VVEDIRITVPVAKVLAAFLTDPTEHRYGLELMAEAELASGTLYPILNRLQKAGWVETHWEDIDPVKAGRPARRYYRLTAEGVTRAQAALASLPRVSPAPAKPTRPALGGAGMNVTGVAW
jgi:PadR family transcriptional regulator PadR